MSFKECFAAHTDPDSINARMHSEACMTMKIRQRCLTEFNLTTAHLGQHRNSQRMFAALFDSRRKA